MLRVIAAGVLLLAISGCAIPVTGQSGTVHYLVVGIGVVNVPAPDQDTSSSAVTYDVVGLLVSNQPGVRMAAGYASGSTVQIPVTANVLISADRSLMGAVTVQQTSFTKSDCTDEGACR
jgi:hypothetical protein